MADNAQKIRLQIVYGTDEEWTQTQLAEFQPLAGELCVDYTTPTLKVGNGTSTWNELLALNGVQYYDSANALWDEDYNCTIPHMDGVDAHALKFQLPVGTSVGQVAASIHNHTQLYVSGTIGLLSLTGNGTSVGLHLNSSQSQTTAANILYAPSVGIMLNIDDEQADHKVHYLLPSENTTANYTIAVEEKIQPMPELQFCSFYAISSDRYQLTFKVTKGTVQPGDCIQICTTSLSTSRLNKTRRYKKRKQWGQEIQMPKDKTSNVFIATLDTKQLAKCVHGGLAADRIYRYPVYLRIARPIMKNNIQSNTLFSNIVPMQIHRINRTDTQTGKQFQLYALR
jgi:hypothetical protein